MWKRRLFWLMSVPPVAQFGAIAVLLWGRPPAGMYAQFAAALVALIVYGALGIQRVRFQFFAALLPVDRWRRRVASHAAPGPNSSNDDGSGVADAVSKWKSTWLRLRPVLTTSLENNATAPGAAPAPTRFVEKSGVPERLASANPAREPVNVNGLNSRTDALPLGAITEPAWKFKAPLKNTDW